MARAEELFERLIAGGEAAVLSFISQSFTEELFLDYKRSADNGAGTALHPRDRANLGKAISGFGNSDGGVIVWGVDCRSDPMSGDVPTAAVHIQNPIRFKSWLEQATGGLTAPAHGGVRHEVIEPGFLITLVPSGMHAPYQTVQDLAYYMRTGSNFSRVPHGVLSGMFGRRPQPSIKHRYLVPSKPLLISPGRVRTQLGLILHNYGRGIARDVFVNLTVISVPGGRSEVRFQPSEERDVWWGRFALEYEIHLVMRGGYVLPPEAYVMPVSLQIELENPIQRDFSFRGTCGSSDGETWRFEFSSSILDMVNAYDQFVRTPPDAVDADAAARRFNESFFRNIPDI